MTVRPIHLAKEHGSSVALLHSSCEAVKFSNGWKEVLDSIVDDLWDTLLAHEICIGLAANQIGVPLSVAVVSLSRKLDERLVLVNPVVLRESGKKDVKYESCMSVPGCRGPVEMRRSLFLSYCNEEGILKEAKFSGFLARAVRHEVDHLNGILYVDRVEDPGSIESSSIYQYDPPNATPYFEGEVEALRIALGSGSLKGTI